MEQLVKRMEQLEQLEQLVEGRARLSLLVLQPTPFCNLDCSYCYLQTRDDRARMADSTLSAIATNILKPIPPRQRPSLVWHGGEPMTLRPQFYETAFEILRDGSGGTPLSHAFQTNGIGITAEWIDLWSKWRVGLGISLDGPADLHDSKRLTRAGRGSHALVMEGIRKLQTAHLPFHVICVLNAESLKDPDRLYAFFAEHDIRRVAFNVEEDEGQAGGSSLDADPETAARYARFLEGFITCMQADPDPFWCREVQNVHGLLRQSHDDRANNTQIVPFSIVSVGVRGELSTFSPELLGAEAASYDDFVFGNVHDGGLHRMQDNSAFQRAAEEISRGVAACSAECAYFEVCGGGAPANKFFELGRFDGTETLYCKLTRQITLEVVLASMGPRPERTFQKAATYDT